MITNLEDMQEVLAQSPLRFVDFEKDAYLQLVRPTEVDPLKLELGVNQGQLVFDSQLPHIPLSKILTQDGVFTFQFVSLEPSGYYVIAVQPLGILDRHFMLLLDQRGNAVIEIPQDAHMPFSLDLGEVTIGIFPMP